MSEFATAEDDTLFALYGGSGLELVHSLTLCKFAHLLKIWQLLVRPHTAHSGLWI